MKSASGRYMKTSDKVLFSASILHLLTVILIMVSMFSLGSSAQRLEGATFDELTELQKEVFNPFNVSVSVIVSPLCTLGWVALFIAVPLLARKKGLKMAHWGAFAFFLAPIAGITLAFKEAPNVQPTQVAQ